MHLSALIVLVSATVRLNNAGQLEVSTPAGGFQDDAPIAYQEVEGQRVPVAVTFAMDDAVPLSADELGANAPRPYGFRMGAYNPALSLVIDPAVLVYCGYIGGNDWGFSSSIAVDTAGNAYVTGRTISTEATFPVTIGPDLTHNGGFDAFVAISGDTVTVGAPTRNGGRGAGYVFVKPGGGWSGNPAQLARLIVANLIYLPLILR